MSEARRDDRLLGPASQRLLEALAASDESFLAADVRALVTAQATIAGNSQLAALNVETSNLAGIAAGREVIATLQDPGGAGFVVTFRPKGDVIDLHADWPVGRVFVALIAGHRDEYVNAEFTIPGLALVAPLTDDRPDVKNRSTAAMVAAGQQLVACNAEDVDSAQGIQVDTIGIGHATKLAISADLSESGVAEDFVVELDYRPSGSDKPVTMRQPVRLAPDPHRPTRGRKLRADFPWPVDAISPRGELRIFRAVAWNELSGRSPRETSSALSVRRFTAFPLTAGPNGPCIAIHTEEQRQALVDPSAVWFIRWVPSFKG